MAKIKEMINLKNVYGVMNSIIIWIIFLLIVILMILCDMLRESVILCECFGKDIYESLQYIQFILSVGCSVNSNEMGILVAIMVVIWTFSINLSMNILDKTNERYFGVEVKDVIKEYGKGKLIMLGISEALQAVLMIVSVIWHLWYTMVVISFIQFYTMIVMFLLVFLITSKKEALKIIEGEAAKILNGEWSLSDGRFFPSMLKNIDYNQQNELDQLGAMLLIAKKVDVYKMENKKKVFLNSLDITLNLHRRFTEKQHFMNFMESWFYKEECGFVKRGILSAFLDWNGVDALTDCYILISTIQETDKYVKMLIWMFVYELYASATSGKQWRIKNCYEVTKEITWSVEENKKIALGYWEELDGSRDRIHILIKWLLENGGDYAK